MKFKRLSIIAITSCILLSGCSSNKQETEEQAAENKPVTNEVNEMVNMGMMGNITEIDVDNNTVTIASMNMGMKGFDGQAPAEGEAPKEMPEGMEKPDDFNPEDMPEGMENVEQGNGGDYNPEDMPQAMGNLENMESNTYNLASSCVINDADGNVISINDLKVNDFVSYTVEDNNLLTISIASMDASLNQVKPKQ